MASVRVELNQAELDRALVGSTGLVTRYVQTTTSRIRNRAVLYAPVRTGNLRGSITQAVVRDRGDVVGLVGTPVEYAVDVHEGHPAGQVQVREHQVRAHMIKAHKVATRTQLAYTVPAKGDRAAYTVAAHTVKAHRVAARTQLASTRSAHTRNVSARAGRPFLRRALHDVLT